MAYLVRLLEMYICGAVPSSICLILLYRLPNANLWKILCFVALILTIAANIWFWYDFIMHTKDNNKEYYTVNIIALIGYMISAAALYKFTNPQIFSFGYAGVRAFEMFGLSTKVSAAVTFAIMAVFMFLTKKFAVRFFGIRVSLDEVNNLVMSEIEDESINMYEINKIREKLKKKD